MVPGVSKCGVCSAEDIIYAGAVAKMRRGYVLSGPEGWNIKYDTEWSLGSGVGLAAGPRA